MSRVEDSRTAAAKMEQVEESRVFPHSRCPGQTLNLMLIQIVVLPGLTTQWAPGRRTEAEVGAGLDASENILQESRN